MVRKTIDSVFDINEIHIHITGGKTFIMLVVCEKKHFEIMYLLVHTSACFSVA